MVPVGWRVRIPHYTRMLGGNRELAMAVPAGKESAKMVKKAHSAWFYVGRFRQSQ